MPNLTKKNLFILTGLLVILLSLPLAVYLVQRQAQYRGKAAGNVYYVAQDGSGDFTTIQAAANVAGPGDTVYIKAGTYNERVNPQNSGSSGNYITYRAYPGDTVIIDGQNTRSSGVAISGKSYLIIDGFEIRNQVHRGVYINSSNNLIIRNNIIKDWGVFGIESNDCNYIEINNNEITSSRGDQSGIWSTNSQHFDIHHNIVHDCPMNGISMSYESDYNKIHHNFVYNNGDKDPEYWAGIALEVNSNYNQIYDNIVYNNKHAGLLTNSQDNYFYHNTVYSNPDSRGWGGGIFFSNWEGSTPENNVVRNNIIIATGNDEYTVISLEAEGRQSSFDNNIHWHVSGTAMINWGPGTYISYSQWRNDYGQEANGFNINPLLVGGDPLDPSFYRLQSNSPAIDAGADVGVTDDYDGNPRPQGAGYDIGAYEYTSGFVPTATPTPPPGVSLPSPGLTPGLNPCRTQPATCRWDPVSQATSYFYQIVDQTGTEIVPRTETTNTYSQSFEPFPNQTYTCRVWAVAAGQESQPSTGSLVCLSSPISTPTPTVGPGTPTPTSRPSPTFPPPTPTQKISPSPTSPPRPSPTPTERPPAWCQRADVNGDGAINARDFFEIVESYARQGRNLPGDLNQDEIVNALDLSLLLVCMLR